MAKRNVDTFNNDHDPETKEPAAIRAALERMKKKDGPQSYAYEFKDPGTEPTLVKLSGVGQNSIAKYRTLFAGHIVVARQDVGSSRRPKFVWFATVAAATKARKGPVNLDDLK